MYLKYKSVVCLGNQKRVGGRNVEVIPVLAMGSINHTFNIVDTTGKVIAT